MIAFASSPSTLSPEQRAVLERLLEREHSRLLRSVPNLEADLAADSGARRIGGDVVDIGNSYASQENVSLLTDHARRTLNDIQNALLRLRTSPETYGVCDRCGGEIPYGRLEILPTTRVCSADAQA